MIREIYDIVTTNATISLISAVFLLWIIHWLSDANRFKRLPPGPWNIPIVGQVPFLAADFDGFTKKMVQKYGNIYRLKLGGKELIMLNGFKAIKEAFITNGDVFSGREQSFALVNYFFDWRGIIMEDGPLQKEQRSFALRAFRGTGVGRATLEDKVHREIERLVDDVKGTGGKPFEISIHLDNTTTNVISSISMDTDFSFDNHDFKMIRDLTLEANHFLETKFVVFIPWLRHISKEFSGFNAFHYTKVKYHSFIDKQIKDHYANLDENNPRDYIDCHLMESWKRQKLNPKAPNPFDEDHLRTNLSLFMVAGMLTTSNTLNWAFKLLLLNRNSQKLMHEEIDRVIGSSRMPRYADRAQMPYTEAFLCEVQRVGDILPMAFPHTNIEEAKLFGYDIPKRSLIFPNLRSVHQDAELWGDPQNFRPERFINKDGKCERPEYLIPFSLGKRACMGESLARMELFLIFVTLLQRFTFSPPVGVVPKLGLESGVGRSLAHFEIRALPRT